MLHLFCGIYATGWGYNLRTQYSFFVFISNLEEFDQLSSQIEIADCLLQKENQMNERCAQPSMTEY